MYVCVCACMCICKCVTSMGRTCTPWPMYLHDECALYMVTGNKLVYVRISYIMNITDVY